MMKLNNEIFFQSLFFFILLLNNYVHGNEKNKIFNDAIYLDLNYSGINIKL